MKKALIIISAVAALILTSCTQNNGYISTWFGYWKMTELKVNGEDVADYNGRITWSFQNNIVCITESDVHHNYDEGFGTWESEDRALTVDFTHWQGVPNTYLYTPPRILQIPLDRKTTYEIVSQSGKEMQLSRVLDDGSRMDIYLKKAY